MIVPQTVQLDRTPELWCHPAYHPAHHSACHPACHPACQRKHDPLLQGSSRLKGAALMERKPKHQPLPSRISCGSGV
eukprot:scaffold45299_cov20-Tisochrysis_lutea.AAC.1